MVSKDKKRKIRDLLGKLDPKEKPNLDIRAIQDEVNDISEKVSNIKYYSLDISSIKNSIYDLKTGILEKLSSLPNSIDLTELKKKYLSEIESIETKFNSIVLDVQSNVGRIEVDYKKDLDLLKNTLGELRIEMLSKQNLGGGSMPLPISIAGTLANTPYADINLIAGSNVTITKANNNTKKRTDVTLSATGGSGSPGGLTGYVQFNGVGSTFAGDSNFFWDNTNKRLGLGTTTPSSRFVVVGNSQFGKIPSFTPSGQLPAFTMWSSISTGNNNAFGVLSDNSSADGGVIIKPNMKVQYPSTAENIGAIQGTDSNLGSVANMAIQGEGGKLYLGAMKDNGGSQFLQVTGGQTVSGNLGIQTNSPIYPLQVGSISASALPTAPTSGSGTIDYGSSGSSFYDTAAGSGSGTTTTIRVYAGNISGAGFIFSTGYLELSVTDDGSSGTYDIDWSWNDTGANFYRVLVQNSVYGYNFDYYLDHSISGSVYDLIDNNVWTFGSTVTPNNGNDFFHVTSVGNGYLNGSLGIGTNSPGYMLTVGSGTVTAGGYGGPNANIKTLLSDTTSGKYTQLAIQGPSSGGAAIEFYNGSGTAVADFGANINGSLLEFINRMNGGSTAFWTTTTGGSTVQNMTLNGDGFLGIGTTTPSTPLSVLNDSISSGNLAEIYGTGGAAGLAVTTTGNSQFIARASGFTDRELRFQLFSDGNVYFGPSLLSGSSATSNLIIRTQSDTGTNLGEIVFSPNNTERLRILTGGNISLVNRIGKYNNISTVSGGVPSELATIDSTGLTANVGATTLYITPSTGEGMYRVSAYLVTTTAASVSSTMPNAQVVFTDKDSNTSVTLDVSPVLGAAGLGQSGLLTANTVGTVFSGSVPIYVKASTTIQYKTVNYASTAAGMAYALRIKLELL